MVYTFACTIGSFINEDWELIEHIVDFKPLEDKEHEGIYAGHAFVNGAKKWGGLDKICCFYLSQPGTAYLVLWNFYFISLTTDNASVNNVIVVTAA
jgi:hypothetical protein